MKIIKELSEMIEDELEGAEEYIKMALREKENDPVLADVFHTLAKEEMGHIERLHAQVVRIIKAYHDKNGEPPAGMMALYEYLHEKHMKCSAQIQWYLNKYAEK